MSILKQGGSALVCYAEHGGAVRSIDADVQIFASGMARFHFVLRAHLAGLRIPQEQTPERMEGLWRHTCFEAFIKPADATGYVELNFSPSLQWALFRFDSYRQGMTAIAGVAPPSISVRRLADQLELAATLDLRDLLGLRPQHLAIGLTAVVERDDGTLCYWALGHPAGKPDFHREEGFLLELEYQASGP